MNKVPLNYKLAQELIEMMKKGIHRRAIQDKVDDNGNYTRVRINESTFTLDQAITIVDTSIYKGLKVNAWKLLIKIQEELKMNNALWECKEDISLRAVQDGLYQLKKKNIIMHLNDNIYFVYPDKLRRGKPLSIMAALYDYVNRQLIKDSRWKPTTEDIKALTAPDILIVPNSV